MRGAYLHTSTRRPPAPTPLPRRRTAPYTSPGGRCCAERRFERRDRDEAIVNERPEGTFTRMRARSATTWTPRASRPHTSSGVLEITIPKPEARKPRRIEIGGGQQKTIEG